MGAWSDWVVFNNICDTNGTVCYSDITWASRHPNHRLMNCFQQWMNCFQQLVLCNNREDINFPYCWPFARKPLDSPHKGPVNRKAFPHAVTSSLDSSYRHRLLMVRASNVGTSELWVDKLYRSIGRMHSDRDLSSHCDRTNLHSIHTVTGYPAQKKNVLFIIVTS